VLPREPAGPGASPIATGQRRPGAPCCGRCPTGPDAAGRKGPGIKNLTSVGGALGGWGRRCCLGRGRLLQPGSLPSPCDPPAGGRGDAPDGRVPTPAGSPARASEFGVVPRASAPPPLSVSPPPQSHQLRFWDPPPSRPPPNPTLHEGFRVRAVTRPSVRPGRADGGPAAHEPAGGGRAEARRYLPDERPRLPRRGGRGGQGARRGGGQQGGGPPRGLGLQPARRPRDHLPPATRNGIAGRLDS
jgi:hypothetical protein